jgi:hypothetical protein
LTLQIRSYLGYKGAYDIKTEQLRRLTRNKQFQPPLTFPDGEVTLTGFMAKAVFSNSISY